MRRHGHDADGYRPDRGHGPIGALGARPEDDTGPYTPLSAGRSVRVVGSDHPSAPQGDTVRTDYQVQIPFVSSDTYSGELEYVAGTQ